MPGPKYPLTVAYLGGRVRHSARWTPDGNNTITLCGKRGRPVNNGARLPYCTACANKPNPQDLRSSYAPADEN